MQEWNFTLILSGFYRHLYISQILYKKTTNNSEVFLPVLIPIASLNWFFVSQVQCAASVRELKKIISVWNGVLAKLGQNLPYTESIEHGLGDKNVQSAVRYLISRDSTLMMWTTCARIDLSSRNRKLNRILIS